MSKTVHISLATFFTALLVGILSTIVGALSPTQRIVLFAQTATSIARACNAVINQVLVTNSSGACAGATWFVSPSADPTGEIDSTSAINAALATGIPVFLPCGTFKVSQIVFGAANETLHGTSGTGISGSNGCTVIKTSSTSEDVLAVNATGYWITDVVIDRSVTASAGAGINVAQGLAGLIERTVAQNQYYGFELGPSSHSTCNLCTAQNNYASGFYLYSTNTYSPIQWQLYEPLSQFNDGYGYLVTAGNSNTTDPVFINSGSYANSSGGYFFNGSSNSDYHNDLQMISPYSSSDGGPGFHWETPGINNVLTGPFAELAGQTTTGRGQSTAASGNGAGFLFDTSGNSSASAVTIVGGVAAQNSFQGLDVNNNSNLQHLILSGFHAWNNGASGTNSQGILIQEGVAHIVDAVSGNYGSTNQSYGLSFGTTSLAAASSVSNSDFSAGNTLDGCQNAPYPNNNRGTKCGGWAYFDPTANGQTFAATPNQIGVNIDAAVNSITSATITLPSGAWDGYVFSISSTATLTLTINPASGDESAYSTGTLSANTALRFQYEVGVGESAPNGKWFAF